MNPFTIYQRYLALKNHFTNWEYDYFQYRGMVKATTNAFLKRNDQEQFFTLAKKHKPLDILLANLSQDPQKSMRDINLDTDVYLDYLRRIYSLTYLADTQSTELNENWATNFEVVSGRHPPLMRLYLAKRISIETASILLEQSGYAPHWREKSKGDILFNDVAIRLTKYAPFLGIKREKIYQNIIDRMIQDAK